MTGAGWLALGVVFFLAALSVQRARRAANQPQIALGPNTELRLGIANEPPYGFLDTQSGQVTGEAPEIARVVLERLGVSRIEVVATEFRSLIPGLRAGRFDVIAAGMYVTPARCAQVLFSQPTYRIGEALLVARGNPARLHAYSDVARHASARVGIVAGSIEMAYAEAEGVPPSRIATLKDPSAAIDSLRARHIDAYAGTALTIRELLRKVDDREFEIAEPFHQPVIDGVETWGYGAFAFRKRDRALRDAWDEQLGRFIGSREHLSLVAPFDFTEGELPGNTRTEQLCAHRGSDS